MQLAIVLSLVLFVSAGMLLYQFLTGALIGADDRVGGAVWPHRHRHPASPPPSTSEPARPRPSHNLPHAA